MSVVARLALLGLLIVAVQSRAETPEELLQRFDAYPHAVRVNYSADAVVDHEIGLGAMRKVRGSWQFKNSERLSGELVRYTWQITDGFTSSEVLAELESLLDAENQLFACDGRSCGQGVQWANRVFRQRLLYGRDDLQRYRVFGEGSENEGYRLLLFSSARTADRQYLHVELLVMGP